MEVNTYLIIILIIIATEFLISLVVSLLDFYYKPTTSSSSVKKDYIKAKRYLRTKIKFKTFNLIINTIILLAMILSGILNNLDIFTRALGYGPVVTGIIFLGIIGVVFFLIGIPFSIFNIFYIEKKYGFNKITPKIFIIDLIKNIIGWIIIGAGGLAVILLFFEKAGSAAWIYCWLFLTTSQIFLMFIYPVFILPIFNKLQILKDGELKKEIKEYLETQNISIKMDNIRIIDSSKRTNKSNAFLCGFGKNKRLVLSDTLLKSHTIPEIVAIVAHEIGHLKKKHIFKKFILYTIESFLIFYLLSLAIQNTNFFLAFGVENISVYLGLMLFSIVYFPIAFFFSTITNYFSKKYEYDADDFSAGTTTPENMVTALDKLGSHNLTNPTPHPATVFLNYSHPPIQDRIKRIRSRLKPVNLFDIRKEDK